MSEVNSTEDRFYVVWNPEAGPRKGPLEMAGCSIRTTADGLHTDAEKWLADFLGSPIGVAGISDAIIRHGRSDGALDMPASCALALTKLAAEAIEARRLRSTPIVISREGAADPDFRAALRHVESPTELLKIITACASALDGGPRQALCDIDILLALAAYADEALRSARRRESAP